MALNLPPAYDLSDLIKELKKRRETRPAGYALEHYLDAASAHTDLLFAQELLATIVMDAQRSIDHPSPYRPAVLGALLAQVILLYARAALVKNERHRFDIRKHLNAEQLDLHKRIAGWRDQAVAHFDRSARHEEALWADERLIFTPSQRLLVRHAAKRLAIRDALVRQLIVQIETVLEIYRSLMSEKHALAEATLRELISTHPKAAESIKKHSFDAPAFFHSFEKAADFLGPGAFEGLLQSTNGPA